MTITKQLAIAGIMLLSAFQVDAKIKKNPTTPQTKKERSMSRIRGILNQQNPQFAQKKSRSARRLIANSNYDLSSGSAVISDSSKYNYLPTNGYGYDETPSLFEIDNGYSNTTLYDDQKNSFDNIVFYLDDGSGSLSAGITGTNMFNSSHQLTQTEIVGTVFPFYQKSNIAYNTGGRKYETIDTTYFAGFMNSVTKTVYTFNANNKVNVIDVFEKDSATQVWIQNEKDSLFYDMNNNLTSAIVYTVSGTTLDYSFKINFTYNAANKVISELDQTWNGTSWDNDGKTTYSYNASNQLTVTNNLVWNGTSWDDDTKTTYNYTTSSYPTTMTNASWDGTTWNEDDKDIFTYNSSNQVLTDLYSVFNGTIWEDNGKSIYYYETYTPNEVINTIANSKISIYPNPIENNLNLNIQFQNIEDFKIAIVDMNGKVLYNSEIINGYTIQKSIDTKSMSPGIYFVKIYTNNGQIVSKFVK